MRPVARIVDASAIRRYLAGDDVAFAAQLVALDDAGYQVLVPALCLSEAYWAVDAADEPLLDVFRTLRQVTVAPLPAGDAQAVGGLARFLGTLGMAHACLLAAVTHTPLLTAEPALAGKLLRPDLIRQV
ncbi:hypothetical protein [Catellatospora tritici]|uniref:hypothetical protein n=1 Tax=Catellatospora tritici TaxID=2851566 RepID=UPI001C2CFBA1|nr:hypothetical protein [Catellatospora tritici]MBV1855708.1 hypothetical protein [Catellatospora tritici]